jgi:hypothetical protein
MTTIELHIERMVLHGLGLNQRQARQVQTAIETELSHLLTTDARWPARETGGAVPTLHGGTIGWQAVNGPATLGQQAAGAVYRSLGT